MKWVVLLTVFGIDGTEYTPGKIEYSTRRECEVAEIGKMSRAMRDYSEEWMVVCATVEQVESRRVYAANGG